MIMVMSLQCIQIVNKKILMMIVLLTMMVMIIMIVLVTMKMMMTPQLTVLICRGVVFGVSVAESVVDGFASVFVE